MEKRKSLSKKTRFEIFKRDSFTCQYCGKSAPDVILVIDHILPVSKGGVSDLLNLLTSCDSCNAGKGARLISDSSSVERQISQLKEINERREQLEFLIKWKGELSKFEDEKLSMIQKYWEDQTPGIMLSDSGLMKLKKLMKKYDPKEMFSAIDETMEAYLEFKDDGTAAHESVNLAFDKLSFFLKMKKFPDYMKELFYIRGILKNRIPYLSDSNQKYSLSLMEDAIKEGMSCEEIKCIACQADSWREFQSSLLEYNGGGR